MARAAHAMAMESPKVIADVIEVQEFPHLAQAYHVRAVPKTVMNDTFEFTGAATEEQLVTRVLSSPWASRGRARTSRGRPTGGRPRLPDTAEARLDLFCT